LKANGREEGGEIQGGNKEKLAQKGPGGEKSPSKTSKTNKSERGDQGENREEEKKRGGRGSQRSRGAYARGGGGKFNRGQTQSGKIIGKGGSLGGGKDLEGGNEGQDRATPVIPLPRKQPLFEYPDGRRNKKNKRKRKKEGV